MRRVRFAVGIISLMVALLVVVLAAQKWSEDDNDDHAKESKAIYLKAPAGNLPANREIEIDGLRGAVLPNGRFITPVGTEIKVGAPKPYGMMLSPDGNTLATVNSGTGPFSITLMKDIRSGKPAV